MTRDPKLGVIENHATKLETDLATMVRQMGLMIEYQKQLAILRKASYDAHIDAGFDKEQALVLCKI